MFRIVIFFDISNNTYFRIKTAPLNQKQKQQLYSYVCLQIVNCKAECNGFRWNWWCFRDF